MIAPQWFPVFPTAAISGSIRSSQGRHQAHDHRPLERSPRFVGADARNFLLPAPWARRNRRPVITAGVDVPLVVDRRGEQHRREKGEDNGSHGVILLLCQKLSMTIARLAVLRYVSIADVTTYLNETAVIFDQVTNCDIAAKISYTHGLGQFPNRVSNYQAVRHGYSPSVVESISVCFMTLAP